MSAHWFSLPCICMDTSFRDSTLDSPWRERLVVAGIVVLLHFFLFAGWILQPQPPHVAVNEMSISFANVLMRQADIGSQLEIKQEPKPVRRVIEQEAVSDPVMMHDETEQATPMESPPSPVQLDAKPEYRADYLNNPRPPYPMVARRMGYQGKVVLNVEVLSDGRAGQVLLQHGSGHEILDNAALQTVKTWRFLPARRLGQPVTQWFLVPIKFSLENDDA